ncbi:hypothetical protein EJB05_32764, partial [Eragrostis curvula]
MAIGETGWRRLPGTAPPPARIPAIRRLPRRPSPSQLLSFTPPPSPVIPIANLRQDRQSLSNNQGCQTVRFYWQLILLTVASHIIWIPT